MTTLMKAAVAFVPVVALFVYSVTALARRRTGPSVLQAVGATCLLIVVLTHVAEGLQLFPVMRWGEPDSAGHYLDLWSAVLGMVAAPIGFILHRREQVEHACNSSSNA